MCKVCAGIFIRLFCKKRNIHGRIRRPSAKMKLDRSGACFFIRRQNQNRSVQPAGSAKCRINIPRMISGGKHKNAFVTLFDAVKFRQKLRDRAASRMPVERSFTAECVQFVKEKNTRSVPSRLLKDGMDVLF